MEMFMPSLRDEAYQMYLLRKEKYSFSEKEQFYVRKIYNDIENTSIPNFVTPESLTDHTLNDNDFIFDETLGYNKLIQKIDKKIRVIKDYNQRIERTSTFYNLRNGNFRKDPGELIALLMYVKYLHYNSSALENPESAYHYISKNTKENNEYYKRYEVYTQLNESNTENDPIKQDQQYVGCLQTQISKLKNEEIFVSTDINLPLDQLRQYLDNLEKERARNIKDLEEKVKSYQSKIAIEQAKKLKTNEMFIYSTKNIIKQLGNKAFSNIASLRKVFEDKIYTIKTKKETLSINRHKALRMQEIQTGSLNIFARYADEKSCPTGIIQHRELLEISMSNNLSNLPPTPITKTYRQSLSREGKLQSLNLLQKLKEIAENPEQNISCYSAQSLNDITLQCQATSTPDSEPLSIASDEESSSSFISTSSNGSRVVHIAVGNDKTSARTSPGNSSLATTPDDSISGDSDSEFPSTQEHISTGGSINVIAAILNRNNLTKEEKATKAFSLNDTKLAQVANKIATTVPIISTSNYEESETPILYLIPSSNTKSLRRKASGDLANLIKELIDSDKNFSKTLNENGTLMQKDLDISRSQLKIDLLDEIIKKAQQVLSDVESRGPQSPVYKTKSFYENIIKQAKADRGAIKALSRYTGLMFFSPEQKNKALLTSSFFVQTSIAAVCIAKTPAASPVPSPEPSPRQK